MASLHHSSGSARGARRALGDVPHLPKAAILHRYEWQRLRSAVRRGQIIDSLRQFWLQFSASSELAMAAFRNDLLLVAPALSERVRNRRLGKLWSRRALPRGISTISILARPPTSRFKTKHQHSGPRQGAQPELIERRSDCLSSWTVAIGRTSLWHSALISMGTIRPLLR